MRKAKIVATLGPSSSSEDSIRELIKAGLNVARINMSHGTHEDHAKNIKLLRQVSTELKKPIAILLDLQGPKIRVDKLPQTLFLKQDEEWVIGHSSVKKNYPQYKDHFIPTTYEHLVEDASEGCAILFDDGLLEAKSLRKEGNVLVIKILVGGELKSNKGINLPDIDVSAPSFTEKDREDLLFGLQHGVDYVALSFVRRKECIDAVKVFLHRLKHNVPIVAKIEKPQAIENIQSILEAADVIMIARGDMGVELGNHLVPHVQKRIINACNEAGVPVITATQMLESMMQNPRPTRAEASDVANAIWDGTDAVMLSGETAAGQYPIEAVKMMDSIIIEAERAPKERPLLRYMNLKSVSASLQVAASLVAEKVNARWIISVTQKGNSCLRMSRFRPKVGVLGISNTVETVRKMCLYWGITPYLFNVDDEQIENLEYHMIELLEKQDLVKRGDKVVITTGDGRFFTRTHSNMLRVEQITEINKKNVQSDGTQFQEASFEKGRILLDTEVCASCQNCMVVCPHDIWAIDDKNDQRTIINLDNAPKCELDMECVDVCPTGAIEIQNKDF